LIAIPTKHSLHTVKSPCHAKEKNIPLSDSRVEFLAKSIAYDELKPLQSVTHKTIEQQKENPIKIYTGSSNKPTLTEKKQAASQDRLYKTLDSRKIDDTGNIEISDIFNGVAVIRNSKGEKINQGQVFYNPSSKMITYYDGKKATSKPIYEIATIAEPANPNVDINMISSLDGYERKSDLKENNTAKANKAFESFKGVLNKAFGGGKKEEAKPTKNWSKYEVKK